MAWTAPRTWVTSEIVTSTIMNAHVRDNLLETAPAKVTQKGDIVAGTGANAIARVGAGGSDGLPLVTLSGCNTGYISGTCALLTFDLIQILSSGSSASTQINLSSIGNGMSYRVGVNSSSQFIISSPSVSGSSCFIISPSSRVQVLNIIACQVVVGSAASNTFMDYGLTINQRDDDNEAFAIKSSDVAHGITTNTDADTFFSIKKISGTNAGAKLQGFSESVQGLYLWGVCTSESTTRSSAASANIYLDSSIKTGTTYTVNGSNVNMVAFGTAGSTRFIFDSDGDFHADAGTNASAFDVYDDAHLIRALELERNPAGIIRTEFDDWLKYNRRDLEAARIASFDDKSVFVNYTGLARLHSGAIWSMYTALRKFVSEVEKKSGSRFELFAKEKQRWLT